MEEFLKRHYLDDIEFEEISENSDTDYSNKPIPILLQPKISQNSIDGMVEYNLQNGTNYGFDVASILSLTQIKKSKKKDSKYKEQFELDKNSGTEYLKNFFTMIKNNDPMKTCIMDEIENTQSSYNNRKSTVDNPKLFLMFLPMGNDIEKLQKTMINFLEKNKLWEDYHICNSNSKSRSDEDIKGYKEFVDKQLEITKRDGKRGCILLLGNQGKMAYTYHDCDVVIRLDNGIDIDDAEQVGYRCLTEGPITDNVDEQKTIGITVDLNIQRVYAVMRNKIKNYKKNNPDSKKTYGEIIQYMYKENQFIFNPNEFDFGNCTDEMIEYYKKYEDKLKSETLVETVICNIQCEDTLCDIIKQIKLKDGTYQSNPKLNGKQSDCPKGEKTKKKADSIKNDEPEINPDEPEINIFDNINKTKNLYEFLTKLCCLMLRIDYKNPEIDSNVIGLLESLKNNEKRFNIIKMKLIDDYDISETDLNIIYDRYIIDMNNQNNIDILDDIFEIYSNSDPKVVRDIIGKHFIPSKDQKKKNAEIPTPPELCDEMIDKIPREYFMNQSNKTFEPCCGKGNFVLVIFERYFYGLSHHIKDECERCIHIIKNSLYFCDIDPMNIYITEELLKCHALSKMKEECWEDWDNVIKICDVKFNSHVGDTLKLDIQDKWGVDGFNAVIGNPPYTTTQEINSRNSTPLYDKFVNKFIDTAEILLYVIPSRWFITGKGLTEFRNNIMLRKDILSIDHVDDSKIWFGPIVDIKGGCCILYKNTNHNGLCNFNSKLYDLNSNKIIINPKYLSIIDIFKNNESIDKLFIGRGKIETNDERFSKTKIPNNDIECWVSTKQSKNRKLYINKTLKEQEKYWKVISPTAVKGAYSGFDNDKLFVLNENQIHSGSYVSFKVQNEKKANSLLSYLKTEFVNKLLSIRKISQTISKDTLKYIPLVPLNTEWNDRKIYDHFKLSDEQIKLIENTV